MCPQFLCPPNTFYPYHIFYIYILWKIIKFYKILIKIYISPRLHTLRNGSMLCALQERDRQVELLCPPNTRSDFLSLFWKWDRYEKMDGCNQKSNSRYFCEGIYGIFYICHKKITVIQDLIYILIILFALFILFIKFIIILFIFLLKARVIWKDG